MALTLSKDGRTVYAGSYDKRVYALETEDGSVRWISSGPAAWILYVALDPSERALYVGSYDHRLYAMDTSNGRLLWIFDTKEWVLGIAVSPSGDTVFTVAHAQFEDVHTIWLTFIVTMSGSLNGVVNALSAHGPPGAMYPVDQGCGSVATSPSGGYSVVASSDNGYSVARGASADDKGRLLYALDVSRDGLQLWNFSSTMIAHTVAAGVLNRTVYVGMEKAIYALDVDMCPRPLDDRSDSAERAAMSPYTVFRNRWTVVTGDRVPATVVSPDGAVVYVGSWDTHLYAVFATNGTQRWVTPMGFVRSIVLSPEADVVYATGDWSVHALRADDGQELWKTQIDVYTHTVLAMSPSGKFLAVGTLAYTVWLLDTADGHKVWWNHDNIGGKVRCVAIDPSDRTVYAASDDHNLYALSVKDGSKLWSKTVDGGVSYVTVDPTGHVLYIGSADAGVYALSSDSGSVQWRYPTGGKVWCVVQSKKADVVYAGANDGVNAINAADGQHMWFRPISGVYVVNVSPEGELVYAGSVTEPNEDLVDDTGPGFVTALSASSGRALWDQAIKHRVYALSTSVQGDSVYVGTAEGKAYAFTTCAPTWTVSTAAAVRSFALSKKGDVLYAGTDGHQVYSVNASSGQQMWQADVGGGASYISPSPAGDAVYVGNGDGDVCALNTSDGGLQWRFHSSSAIRQLVASPSGPYVYVAAADHNVYALYTDRTIDFTDIDWASIEQLVLGCGVSLLLALWILYRCTQCPGKGLTFCLAGASFGFAVGSMTGYVIIRLAYTEAIRSLSESRHEYHKWRMHSQASYSMAIIVCMVVMGAIWILAERINRLVQLTHLCSMALLVSALLVSSNLVPGLWLTCSPTATDITGSHPGILVAWLVLSYPTGMATLVAGLALLEALYMVLERGERRWRGHIYTRWVQLSWCFTCGFVAFWGWTVVVMYFFNLHGVYVPPHTPLDVVSLAVGLASFIATTAGKPSPAEDVYACSRHRAWLISSYVTWWPWGKDEWLRDRWQALNGRYQMRLTPKRVLKLCLNAWCPNRRGVRERVSRWSGLGLTPSSKFQATLKDELNYAFLKFVLNVALAVAPLVIYWFYQRFGENGRSLSLDASYMGGSSLWGQFQPVDILPIPTIADKTPPYIPMVFPNATPFIGGSWRNMGESVDPGDFEICMNATIADCLSSTCEWPTCQGITPSIRGEPSESLWFNMQLVVYIGFFLFGLWVIAEEAEEKLHVSVALSRDHLFREDANRGRRTFMRRILAIGFLLVLGAVYIASLYFDTVTERFYIFAHPEALQDASLYYVSSMGATRGMRALASAMQATLVWYCDAFKDSDLAVIMVTYSLDGSSKLEVAIIQGLYFAYQSYTLLASQREIYDFIDRELLFSTRVESSCLYHSIHQVRDSGRSMSREDTAEYLHQEVYLPFLAEVHVRRPNLISTLFNHDEAEIMGREAEEGLARQERRMKEGDESSDDHQGQHSRESFHHRRSKEEGGVLDTLNECRLDQ